METQTTINTHVAIARVRRGTVLAAMLRGVLIVGVVCGIVLEAAGWYVPGALLIGGVLTVLFVMAGRTVRVQQEVGRAGTLIEAGQFAEAEAALGRELRSFPLYRAPRLGLLQNLAALRHAQRRYREAGSVATELLRYVHRDPALSRTLNLMLAECALETSDLPAVHAALSQVGASLPVRETLKLMELQVEYCVRIGAWAQVLDQAATKVELCELMPADAAARVQSLLALSARRIGRSDWESWLKRRVELLTDVPAMVERRPILRELFEQQPA